MQQVSPDDVQFLGHLNVIGDDDLRFLVCISYSLVLTRPGETTYQKAYMTIQALQRLVPSIQSIPQETEENKGWIRCVLYDIAPVD